MVIKVFISGICGSHEVRKQQQRVLFILQSLPINLQVIDVTEPGRDEDLVFMQETAKKHDKATQLPPQIFNDLEYCGDYADFEVANDDDEIMKFLKLEDGISKAEILQSEPISQNGITNHESNKEISENLEINDKIEIDSELIPQNGEFETEEGAGENLEETEDNQNITPAVVENEVEKESEENEKKDASEEESEEESE